MLTEDVETILTCVNHSLIRRTFFSYRSENADFRPLSKNNTGSRRQLHPAGDINNNRISIAPCGRNVGQMVVEWSNCSRMQWLNYSASGAGSLN